MFPEIIGQDKIKSTLKIVLNHSIKFNETIPHTLFTGASGCGKTTFAYALANRAGRNLHVLNGANVSQKDFMTLFILVEENDIVFIDEIHRLNKKCQEFIYGVMEEYMLPVSPVVRLDVAPCTIIGATTDEGLLLPPMLNRFVLSLHVEDYNREDLITITKKYINDFNLSISNSALFEIVNRSRFTPRVIRNTLIILKKYYELNKTPINVDTAKAILYNSGIQENGFTTNDVKYLKALSKLQPAGVQTLSATTGIKRETIERIIEPFLLRLNKIKKTPKGRVLV